MTNSSVVRKPVLQGTDMLPLVVRYAAVTSDNACLSRNGNSRYVGLRGNLACRVVGALSIYVFVCRKVGRRRGEPRNSERLASNAVQLTDKMGPFIGRFGEWNWVISTLRPRSCKRIIKGVRGSIGLMIGGRLSSLWVVTIFSYRDYSPFIICQC